MSSKIQIKRGASSLLPILNIGELGFSTDTKQIHIGTDSVNYEILMHELYDANTVLIATSDNTPTALTINEQCILGRKTGGNIAALTASEVLTILDIDGGADVTSASVSAVGAVMNSIFDEGTFLYATSNDTPEPKTLTEVRSLLNVADGSTSNSSDIALLNRGNHTSTQTASTISDFDTEVSNNVSVTANTAKITYPSEASTKLATIAPSANNYEHPENHNPSVITQDADNRFFTDTERTKLATIAPSATVDQTGAEIKSLYESESDTNAFTDTLLSKLNNVESGADVTDVTNVTAAGALMDSEVDVDIKTLSLPANTIISDFGSTLIDDIDANAARATLGLSSKSNTITVAISGGDYTSIQSAIDNSSSGDTILIYDGTYTEAVTTKAGSMITLVGMGTMGSVVIQQDTGTCLTVPSTFMSMAFIKNLKLKSNATGTNVSKLFVGSGMMCTFNSVSFDYDIANGYVSDIIDLDSGVYVFSGCKFAFDGTGTAGGESNFITTAGTVEFNLMQGFGATSFAAVATTDKIHFIKDVSSGSNIVRDFDITLEASSTSFAGNVGFYHSENSNEVELLGNKVVVTTPSGIGTSKGNFAHLAGTSGCHVHSTANRIKVSGFVTDTFAEIDVTETLSSHFDDIVADSGVIGDGTYHYANSPSDGDIQMSGDIIQKVVSIETDHGSSADWNFGILSASPSGADITATFNTTEMNSLPDGAKKTFANVDDTYNLIIDTNEITVGGSTNDRVIYPSGYIIIEKIGNNFIITGSKNTSFNIELTDISNKTFHVDFSDNTTVTLDGTDIDQIDDKINSWAGTPSNSGKATYVTASQNGLNTALFNEYNSPISFGDRDLHSNTSERGLTVIAIVKPRYANDAIISKYADNVANREWRFYTSSAVIFDELDASGSEASLNFSSNYEEWQILEMTWQPGNRLSIYKNGFLMGISSYTTTDIPAGTANLLLGASDIAGADYMGEIGEVITISDTLTSDERAALTSKLGAKWDIDVATFSAGDSSQFGRDDITSTIKPLIDNDNLDIGTGTFNAGSITVSGSTVATEEYVDDNSSVDYTVVYNNSDTTINLAISDLGKTLLVENVSAVTVNLPSVTGDNIGKWTKIHKMGAGNLTINRADSDTIEDGTNVSNIISTETWASISLFLATATKWKFEYSPMGTWNTA
jgi:hypothetical protein